METDKDKNWLLKLSEYEKSETWICPNCSDTRVVEDALGWRHCPSCNWKEEKPTELAVAASSRYSKETKKVLETVRYKLDKGVDPQIAFRDAIISVGLDGMDQPNVEKRMDIAAILWDEDNLDLDPIKLDRRSTVQSEPTLE